MSIQVTNVEKPNYLTFKFRMAPTHVSYANTLRRLMLTAVETVSFRADMTAEGTTTDVVVVKNDTPMTNEMLAHRVGLIPLFVKQPLTWKPDSYIFKLSKTGRADEAVDITTADFEVKTIGLTRLILQKCTRNFHGFEFSFQSHIFITTFLY